MSLGAAYAGLHAFESFAQLFPILWTGDFTGTWTEPFRRGQLQDANWQTPNVLAPLDAVLSVYYTGGCTWEEAHKALRYLGIITAQLPDNLRTGGFWSQVADIRQPRVPLEIVLRQDALGIPVRESLTQTIRRYGYRYDKDHNALKTDSNPLDITMLLALWRTGVLRDNDLERYLKHAGYRNDEIINWVKQYRTVPSIGEAILSYWAGNLTYDEVKQSARFYGYVTEKDISTVGDRLFNFPGAGTVIDMSRSQAFDDNYAGRWGLDQEKPPELEYFMRKTGQSFGRLDIQPNGWINPNNTPGDYYWRSHWTPIDPGTAWLMFHRLRETGGPGNGPRIPGVKPFTQEQLTDVLQRSGVMPGARDQLTAVSYNIPQRLYVKRLYAENIIDLAEVRETLKDQGYNDTNAANLATLVHKEVVAGRVDKIRPVTANQVKDAYRVGIIDRAVAEHNLYIVSLTDPDQIRTQLTLPLGTYADGGMLLPFVQAALNAIDVEVAAELGKQAIEVFHKAYLRGEIDANNARNSLITLGIVFNRATQYVQLWTYELATQGVEVSAAKLVDFYVGHLIDQQTLYNRLIGLHYSPTDANLIIAAANVKLSEAAAKLQQTIARAKAQEQKQLTAAAVALQKQQSALARTMCRSGNAAQVAKWAALKLIGYPEAYQRITDCGKTPDDAIRLLAIAAKLDGEKGYETIKEKVGAVVTAPGGNGQVATTT